MPVADGRACWHHRHAVFGSIVTAGARCGSLGARYTAAAGEMRCAPCARWRSFQEASMSDLAHAGPVAARADRRRVHSHVTGVRQPTARRKLEHMR